MTQNAEPNHAEQNAQGHLEYIMELFAECTYAEDEIETDTERRDRDTIEEEARESALSVEVRSDWHSIGADEDPPSEYKILLTTGGPALRLIGSLNLHGQLDSVRLEYQDWGTPWTEYRTDSAQDAALEWFAGLFYFGE